MKNEMEGYIDTYLFWLRCVMFVPGGALGYCAPSGQDGNFPAYFSLDFQHVLYGAMCQWLTIFPTLVSIWLLKAPLKCV